MTNQYEGFEDDCDQCIVEAVCCSKREIGVVPSHDPICPECKLRICSECAKDHIFCYGPGEDMTIDLGVVSNARARGATDHALLFFKPEYHGGVMALPRVHY